MKRTLYMIKSLAKLTKIDWNNPTIAAIQLNGLKQDFATAMMKGIITFEDYQDLTKAIEETKENLKK